jgi:hypothetical protein
LTSLTLAGDGIRPAARWVAPAFCVAYALLLLAPWRFVFPMPGIEPSWAEVIAFAAREGWQWGRDVVFTYGPLGYLSIGSFADAQLPSLLVVTTALSLLFGLGVAVLLPRESPVAALLLGVVALVPAAIMGRFVFGMLGLLAALCHFSPPTRARQATAIALAAGAGVAALAHLYAAAAGLAMLILVDASRALTSRRWPVHVATFAGAALVAYVAGGQDITGLPSFLRGTFEVISGYGGAMSLPGSKLEIAAYVLASVVVVGLVARHERATRGSALVVAVVALWLFMALKIGFVRHDQHSAGAWAMMAVATSAYAATRWPLPTARATCVALVAVAVGSIVAAM